MHRGTIIFYFSINQFRGLYPFIIRSTVNRQLSTINYQLSTAIANRDNE